MQCFWVVSECKQSKIHKYGQNIRQLLLCCTCPVHIQFAKICCPKHKVQRDRETCCSCSYNRVLCQVGLLHRATLFLCGHEYTTELIGRTVVDLDKNTISMDLPDILHSSRILSDCSFNHVCMFVYLAEGIKHIVCRQNHVSSLSLRYS